MSEDGDEFAEDKMFIRWVHGVRRLNSMFALRESASVTDVRREQKLRYDYAKIKASGCLWGASGFRCASAASAAASSRQSFDTSSPAFTASSEKLDARQDKLGRGAQKRQWRMDNIAGRESHTPMSFQP
uniref:Uncharacterized protein n=1 Tax=Peronospora matthiolae TaxID=2874970 RepID=A0AAV1URU1_9STRA